MADGVLLIGPERNVLYANRSFVRLWNIADAALSNLPDREVFDIMAARFIDAFAFCSEAERLVTPAEPDTFPPPTGFSAAAGRVSQASLKRRAGTAQIFASNGGGICLRVKQGISRFKPSD